MQKKVLLVLAVIICSLASRAQADKGDWLLGGSFGVNFGSNNSGSGTTNSSNSNLTPELGVAIAKNSIIGIRGGFNYNTSKNGSAKQTSTSYSAGAFWKKLFAFTEKAGWYSDLGAGFTYGKTSNTNFSNYETSSNGFFASLAPGVYYKPTKKIFLNAGVGGIAYNYSKSEVVGFSDTKSSNLNVNLLNYFTFGVSFILGKDHQM